MNHQQIKSFPKTTLLNCIKAIPDSLVSFTFIDKQADVIISGKSGIAINVKSITSK